MSQYLWSQCKIKLNLSNEILVTWPVVITDEVCWSWSMRTLAVYLSQPENNQDILDRINGLFWERLGTGWAQTCFNVQADRSRAQSVSYIKDTQAPLQPGSARTFTDPLPAHPGPRKKEQPDPVQAVS